MGGLDQWNCPPPEDHHTFEEMMCDLFGAMWDDPYTKQYGRLGQRQHGVDVFGRPHGGQEYEGVQCKCVKSLSESDVRKAYQDSTEFEPKLARFIVVTTARRDAKGDRVARALTEQGPYPCIIYFWDDIRATLANYGGLMRKYYGGLYTFENVGDSPGKLVAVTVGSTRYELLLSRMPDNDEHYRGTVLVSDLANKRCQTYRIGDDWSRLHGFVGYGAYDAFVVSKWLNSLE